MVYGDAGKAVFQREVHNILDGCGVLHRSDVRTVRHRLVDGRVAEIEDVRDHVLGALPDHAGFFALVHHHEDFFLGDGLLIFVGVISHQFEHEIGRCGQEGDKRVEDGGDGV